MLYLNTIPNKEKIMEEKKTASVEVKDGKTFINDEEVTPEVAKRYGILTDDPNKKLLDSLSDSDSYIARKYPDKKKTTMNGVRQKIKQHRKNRANAKAAKKARRK